MLTGAGCSTESGIPDYRGPGTRRRAHNPIRMSAFLRDEASRRKYWARSFVGFVKVARARPNSAHHAAAELEARGRVSGLITQNVDSLHERAGSRNVVELHGSLRQVRCLDCGARQERASLQRDLERANPSFSARVLELAPDGDAEVADADVAAFQSPACAACGGVLKPDVVFFGESVPRERVDRARAMVRSASALVVVGSSLTVFSGYRFVKQAAEEGKPIAIVNLTETRGDRLSSLVVRRRAGAILPHWVSLLGPNT